MSIQSQQQPKGRQTRTLMSSGVPALLEWYSNNFMEKLNCLCASENQVLDEVEDFDDISITHDEHLPPKNFMSSYHFDDFEQQDESNNSIHRKDTLPTQNSMSTSYHCQSRQQKSPQSTTTRQSRRLCQKWENSLDSPTSSSADTYTTVSLSQSYLDEEEYDDEDEDDVCHSTATTEVNPFRSTTRGADDSSPPKHDHEAYLYLLRMKPDNYIRDNDHEDDDDLSFVGQLSYLRPVFFSEAAPPPPQQPILLDDCDPSSSSPAKKLTGPPPIFRTSKVAIPNY
jgi:hypothetical protein